MHLPSRKKILRYLNLSIFPLRELYLLFSFDIFLLFFSWNEYVSFLGIPFNFLSIYTIHTKLLVFITDLLILFFPIGLIVIKNHIDLTANKLKEKHRSLEKRIDENIKIANIIGKGEYIEVEKDELDQLGTTLVELGNNLKLTKEKENELNWISRGKEQLSDLLRQYNKIDDLSFPVLKAIVDYLGGVQGTLYLLQDNHSLKNVATYAYNRRRYFENEISVGKGLVGAVAYEKATVYRKEIPDDYFSISSGILGDTRPKSLFVVPLMQEDELQGVFEVAFLSKDQPDYKLELANEISDILGRTIYNLKINAQTETLLIESQKLTATLKENEEQLRQNALEMMNTQEELEKSNQMLGNQIQEVEHAQKRLEALLTNASEFISIYDQEKMLIFESPSVKRILGYKDDDIVTGMDPDLMTPRGYKTIKSLFDYLLETPGGEQSAQYTYLKKNGEKLYLETQGKNLLHDPAIKGLIFNTQDITERKRAEKEERMKSRMQSLSENSPDMIVRINLVGKIVYANPVLADFIGIPVSEITKKRISEVVSDENFIQFVENAISSIKEEQVKIISEVPVVSPLGERIMEIKGIPELNEEKDLESILFVAHDMTEFKKIESEIKEKNKKISDSINYAQRIQTSILPDTGLLQQFFPRSFIFYRPKDVVSGDFPWFVKKGDELYVAAVDCTGHGVPGALLSFIGYFLLNNIVSAEHNLTAAEILEKLHGLVRTTLKQDQDGANGRDGMDLALVKIIPQKNKLEYAGAHRPLYYVRNGELTEYSGTSKGIGGIPLKNKVEKEFENHEIDFQKGDKFFIFSDGLPDQLGGPDRRKYQARRIREILVEDPESTMAHFSRQFSKDFYEWMGDEKQVDDVLLIGIEL